MIFFVMLSVNGREYEMFHAEANNEAEAGQKARDYVKQQCGITAQVDSISLAFRQSRKRYSFPEEIL